MKRLRNKVRSVVAIILSSSVLLVFLVCSGFALRLIEQKHGMEDTTPDIANQHLPQRLHVPSGSTNVAYEYRQSHAMIRWLIRFDASPEVIEEWQTKQLPGILKPIQIYSSVADTPTWFSRQNGSAIGVQSYDSNGLVDKSFFLSKDKTTCYYQENH